MNDIVRFALRTLILSNDESVSGYDKMLALDELLMMERKSAEANSNVPIQWHGCMAEFRTHRANNPGGRIGTIKLVRERIGCGLSEALIIVKGIETQDGIV